MKRLFTFAALFLILATPLAGQIIIIGQRSPAAAIQPEARPEAAVDLPAARTPPPGQAETDRRLDQIEQQQQATQKLLAELLAELKAQRDRQDAVQPVVNLQPPPQQETVAATPSNLETARQLLAYYDSRHRTGISGSVAAHQRYHGVPSEVITALTTEENLRLHSVIHRNGNTWAAASRNLLGRSSQAATSSSTPQPQVIYRIQQPGCQPGQRCYRGR